VEQLLRCRLARLQGILMIVRINTNTPSVH
jgi:hypothetical protein